MLIQGPSHSEVDQLENLKVVEGFPKNCTFIYYSLKWITLYGTKYHKFTTFRQNKYDPTLWRQTYVFGRVIETERYEEDYNGYSVDIKNKTSFICSATKLLDYNNYQIIETIDGSTVIPLKYELLDIIEQHSYGSNPLHEKN